MKKKLVFLLIIMLLIIQPISSFKALADENIPPIPEPSISVKIENHSKNKRIYEDDELEITLQLKAYLEDGLDIKAEDITATIDDSSAFYIPSSTYQVIKFKQGDSDKEYKSNQNITLKYKGTGNNLTVSIKYKVTDGKESKKYSFITSATLYIDNVVEEDKNTKSPDPVDTTKYKPYLIVWGNTQIPTLEAGRQSAIPFYIKNQSQYTAKNIIVSLETADDSSGIIFNTLKTTKTIDRLNSDSSKDLYFSVDVDPMAKTGIYSVKVNITYSNLYNDSFETSETIRVKVENNNSSPEITLVDMETLPEVIIPGNRAKLKLHIKNTGSLAAEDVKVTLTGLKSDGFIVSGGIPEKHIDKIDGGSTQAIEFDLICSHEMEDGYKELGVKLEYKNFDRETKSYETQIFLPVAASGDMSLLRSTDEDENEDEDEIKTVPRLIINQYELSDEAVKAGQKIGVSLSFLNTSQEIAIRNLKATLMSMDGVFTTEGSNSFFVQEVGPGNSFQKDISVFAKPDAEPKIYNLTIKLEYEDHKGNPYSSEELISIPVQQDSRLVLGDLNLPPENYVGQPIPLYIEFYNMGKATLYNLMIKLEGDFEGAKPSYFVGNFDSGRSDSFDVMFTVNSPGEVSGRVLFSFEDSAGNPTEIAKEFVLNVMEMPMPPDMGEGMYPGMEEPVEAEKDNIWTWVGSIAAAVAIIVIIILRKRHNKKKEMIFDEAI